MYGTQPTAARRLAQLPQKLADGGLVARMKIADAGPVAFGSRGLSQLRDMVPQMAAMGYHQQAQAPAQAPVSDQRAAQLMAMIPQMEAMGYKQKPQMLARGGLVRGPGTGTSDSIATEAEPGTFIMPADSTQTIGPSALEKMGTVPVRLSDGEYKMPPEQVMALGSAVLKLLKDATHTPVNGQDGGQTYDEVGEARGFNPADRMAQMPEQMFADGGLIENDVTRVGNSYSGGNVGGNITINGAAPGGTVSQGSPIRPAAPAAQDPAAASTNPAAAASTNPAAAVSSAASAATTPATPATPATSAAPAQLGWAERNARRNLEVTASSIMDSPERRMAQAALAPPPTPQQPAPAAAPTAAQQMGAAPSTFTSRAAYGFQPRRYADGGIVEDDPLNRIEGSGSGGSGGGAGGVTGSWEAQPNVTAQAPQPAGALSRAASMSAPATTQISAQNMAAADSLARRSAADAMASMPNAPAPVQAPTIRHSGNDWQTRNDLRNAMVSATSITNDGGKWDKHGKGVVSPERAAYLAMLGTDQALKSSAPALAQQGMREQGDTQRAGMQVAASSAQSAADRMGAMDRTLIGERGANSRAGITAWAATEAARIKAQQDNKAPPGYRYTVGGNMEAIPGGPADLRQNKEGVQQGKDTQDIFSIINEARPLMANATGSYGGVALDKVGQAVGYATDGAKATAQLKALQGALVSKMPKMTGPQSDKDVLLYREMAGQIGDPTIPVEQRKAAMGTIENLNMKYLPQAAGPDDLAQVPSGAWFRAPDGSVRRKP